MDGVLERQRERDRERRERQSEESDYRAGLLERYFQHPPVPSPVPPRPPVRAPRSPSSLEAETGSNDESSRATDTTALYRLLDRHTTRHEFHPIPSSATRGASAGSQAPTPRGYRERELERLNQALRGDGLSDSRHRQLRRQYREQDELERLRSIHRGTDTVTSSRGEFWGTVRHSRAPQADSLGNQPIGLPRRPDMIRPVVEARGGATATANATTRGPQARFGRFQLGAGLLSSEFGFRRRPGGFRFGDFMVRPVYHRHIE